MTARAISTGVPGLDELLSGGFREGSCSLLEGVPGTGKTTVGLQFIYHSAMSGNPGIIVTFEEFPRQLKQDTLNFGWDLAQLEAEGKLRIICTSPEVFLDQLQDVGGIVEATVAEIGATRLLMDSVSHFSQMGREPGHLRAAVYGMMNGLRRAGLTSVITKELESFDTDCVPFEEFLADCVVRLRYDTFSHNQRRRYVEVLKSRGAPHVPGKHMLELTDRGAAVYPRHQPSKREGLAWARGLCRTPTGIRGLDEMLGGGLICGFSTLVAGSAGVGKTTVGLQFVSQGAGLGEKSLYVSFEESPVKLTEIAQSYGLPLREYQDQGLIQVVYCSPLDTRPEKFIHDLKEQVDTLGAKRVVIDSLTDLQMGATQEDGLRELVYAVGDALEDRGVTSLLIAEVPEVFGQTQVTGEHISIIVDCIILLKYVEMESEIQRALSVLKLRGSDHDKGIRRFTISNKGLTVHGRFEGTEGLMAGAARAVPIELAVRSFSEFDEKLNEELLERFAQIQPRVKPVPLSIPYNPDEARDVVVQAMAARQTSLSVVPLCMYWMPGVIQPDRLSSLNDIFPPGDWEEHLEGVVEPALVDGEVYAVPAIALCGVLLYRRDILQEHGFSAPPATWDELVDQAKTICSAPGNENLIGFEFPAFTYEGLSSSFLVNLWSNGGQVIDDATREMTLDAGKALEVVRFMRDLIHVHAVTPREITAPGHGVEPQENFLAGRTVFLWMLPSVMQPAMQTDSAVRGKVGIAPAPVGPSGTESHSFLGGWHYAVPRGALAPSTARDFIRFMSSYEIQKERALRGGPLPTLKALYDDQEILAFQPHYRELKQILASARTRERIPDYQRVSRAIQSHIYPVLQGHAEPEAAVEAMLASIRHIIDEALGR
ncbi:MAG: extracellular solute-binding protein [Armatimonadetes bacterium]|nr:extracellular solute-binding protein [Armatimonadota bacterium]